MRYAARTLFFVLFFHAVFFHSAWAKASESNISFEDSDALTIVLDAIYDASFDFEGVYVITHNIEFLTEKKKCEVVSPYVIIDHFEQIFAEFTSYYPDEELPYEQAIVDLKELTFGSDFKRCFERLDKKRGFVEVTHYESLSHPLWIRIEYSVGY